MVMSSTKLRANAAPIPTLSPAAAASARLLLLPLWLAWASKLPNVNVLPLPISADVSLLAIVSANAGVAAIPPALPAVALLSMLLSEAADKFRLPALLRMASFSMDAMVWFSWMANPMDAPMPNVSPLVDRAASAVTWELFWFCASSLTFP